MPFCCAEARCLTCSVPGQTQGEGKLDTQSALDTSCNDRADLVRELWEHASAVCGGFRLKASLVGTTFRSKKLRKNMEFQNVCFPNEWFLKTKGFCHRNASFDTESESVTEPKKRMMRCVLLLQIWHNFRDDF